MKMIMSVPISAVTQRLVKADTPVGPLVADRLFGSGKGVVHRDLKPEYVFVTKDERLLSFRDLAEEPDTGAGPLPINRAGRYPKCRG